jgi:AcrR family transcriptional regulator
LKIRSEKSQHPDLAPVVPAGDPTDRPAPVLGLRERKKLRTEADLRDAALRLALERGFDHVTIDDIAAAVEVSKTTFYRYFDSKEDALLGNPTEKTQRLKLALADQPDGDATLSAVRNAIMSFTNSYEHDRDATLARGRIIRSTPSLQARNLEHQALWEQQLAEFVAGRLGAEPDADLRARVVAAIVVATLRATLDYWRDTNGRDDLAELMDTTLAMLAEKRSALVAKG